jgi:hypothetical protein
MLTRIDHVGIAWAGHTPSGASSSAAARASTRARHGSMGGSIAFLHPADVGGVLTELVESATRQIIS